MLVDSTSTAAPALVENDQFVQSLQHAVRNGNLSLDVLPALIVRIVDEERWQRRWVSHLQREVVFESFEAFVSAKVPLGLNASVNLLRNLSRDRPDAIDAIDRATRLPVGTNQHRMPFHNVQGHSANEKAPTGNRSDTALRRLRDDRPDLHARVLAKDLSPHAAMREAGFRRPTLTVRLDDPTAMAGSIARHVDRAFIAELIAELHHVADGMEN